MQEYFELIDKNAFYDLEVIKDSTIAITGATGYLGSNLAKHLLYINSKHNSNIKIIALCRDLAKASKLLPKDNNLEILPWDIDSKINLEVDYIIHLASPTKSSFFVNNPVETLDSIITGTKNILEIARDARIKKLIYLSSMEMYGEYIGVAAENNIGNINLESPRSSYSEGKRVAELYCNCYASEYNISVDICRLAMCFGPGVLKGENRAYMSFLESAKNGEVEIQSSGQSTLNYISILDAINGILGILTNSAIGETYNLCADYEDATIKTLATKIADKFNAKTIIRNNSNLPFAPDNKIIISNEKIKKLGFKQIYNLDQTVSEFIKFSTK